MDVQMHNSRTVHYGLNDHQNRCSEDDLQFLSLEERECILFFEETIGSLEEDEDPTGFHDIIDLVHPPPLTDEVKVSCEETDHRPPASPVQASDPAPRRRSLDSPQNPSAKPGPPTHAKPTRLPESISVLLGGRDLLPHTLATEAVSAQERRAQVLASLTGSAHPLDGGEPACVRNLPMRSISFRDPTPDKSRMEALSKLGLAQRRAQSVSHASPKTTAETKPTSDQGRSTAGPVLTSAEVTHSDFNSYGGKSITLNPSLSFRADYVCASEASEVHLNSRIRVPTPAEQGHAVRPKTKEDSSTRQSEDSPKRRPQSQGEASRPTPAPRPPRPRSPELLRKALPKTSFRTQGITVQFSGRGGTDEARRDALRRLGLLKDHSHATHTTLSN